MAGRGKAAAMIWRRAARSILRSAIDAARSIVMQALAERDRRGERSIQVARVMGPARPHPLVALAMSYVDVTCEPSGIELTATLTQPLRGARVDVIPGDMVLVAVPRGDLLAPSYIIAVLPTGVQPQPVLTAPTNFVFQDMFGQIEMRAPLGVTLNGPGPGVARIGDTVTLSPALVTWLTNLATAAMFLTPIPGATGTITTGSATVQAGA